MRKRNWRFWAVIILCGALLLCFSACACDHDFGKWKTVKKATCTEAGERERECYECSETETKEIPALDHDYEEKLTTEANCQGEGTYTYTCKNCEDTYTEAIPVTTYTPTEIYDLYLESVGEVTVYDKQGYELGLGSCFVYEEDGVLITNYHVIEGAYSADVTFGDDIYEVEEVLAYDKDIDIAVLKISESGMQPVVLCDEEHSVGETVYAFGSSRGLTATFSDGMITANREVDGVLYVQHDVPISGGNSGGPLINVYGEVIGINTWTVVDAQNLNFAIHLSELNNLDFDNPMTLQEVYTEENDPFEKIMAYVLSEGDYDEGLYSLELNWSYSDDYESIYTWGIWYTEGEDTFELCFLIDDTCYVGIEINQYLHGTYDWEYMSAYGDKMSGKIYGQSFDGSTTLSYTYQNISDDEERALTCVLATKMIDRLLKELDNDLLYIDVTVADLGFLKY